MLEVFQRIPALYSCGNRLVPSAVHCAEQQGMQRRSICGAKPRVWARAPWKGSKKH